MLKLHIPTIGVVRMRDEVLTVIGCLIASSAVAFLAYRFVERPMTNVLRKWLRLGKMRRDAVAEANLAHKLAS
jgi:peptidoglycan/LPS O-acetylase OafA/YrhL